MPIKLGSSPTLEFSCGRSVIQAAPQVNESIGIQAPNRNAWSARQLQRFVSAQRHESCRRATQRERARSSEKAALRSGVAAQRGSNDFVAIARAGSDPTTRSRSVGRGAHARAGEAFKGEHGPAHERRRQIEGARVEGGAFRRAVIQFSLCALTP